MIDEKQRKHIETTDYYKYAKRVVDGKRIAGKLEILTCKRFLSDLERDDLIFKIEEVEKVIKFISILKLTDGKWANKPFQLMDWHTFIVANIYGFYWKEDDTRRFTLAYVEVGRKNAKTTLMAAITLYELIGTGLRGNQIVASANSREQAKILLTSATKLLKTIDPKGKLTSTYRNDIRFNAMDGVLKVVSADSSKLDGLSIKCFIVDELHEAVDSSMFDVLRSSQGAIDNPLGILITTAGFKLNGFCYNLRNGYVEMLNGIKQDDSVFAIIYTIDDDDDWKDPTKWEKANPALGISVNKKFLEQECHSAILNSSLEVSFKTKLLNKWCASSEVWLPDQRILDCMESVDLDEYGEDDIGVLSFDLASTNDITSLSLLFPNVGMDKPPTFKTWYFVPQDSINERGNDKWMYEQWIRQGHLIATSGNITDYDYVRKLILELQNKYLIYKVAYDSWNSSQFVIKLTEDGLPLIPFSQTAGNFNSPTREMERLVLSKGCVIDNNPITRWMFQNAVIFEDNNSNRKPKKNINGKKIDGLISMLMGLGQSMKDHHISGDITI